MGFTLITGASGFVGRAVARAIANHRDVVCMSRRNPGLDLPFVRGSFAAFEDLVKLDKYEIDAVIHLAAETGGSLERDAMLVNVEGSRCLIRYLIDRGCRKFVMASSIAAVGFQSVQFRPLQVPIPDEHPCLDRDGYGFSKYLMEEVTRYYARQVPDADFIDLRLATVCADDRMPKPARVGPLAPWALGSITVMALSDAVRALAAALDSPVVPGVRVLNAAPPVAWVLDPVEAILRNWWGDDVDLSHFEQAGHEYDSVFDVERIRAELGFEAEIRPPST